MKQGPNRDYEYDSRYNTRVNLTWPLNPCPLIVAFLLIPLGIMSIVWSATDIGAGALVNPASFNPNYFNRSVLPRSEDGNLAASWHENSIWPTIGKGIWVGFLMIVTGILALSSKCDGSQISVSVFNILAWTTMLFSLYLVLSSVLSIEAQQYNNISDRTKEQKIEIAMNSLLIASGTFSFIICLLGAVSSCISLDYCTSGMGPKYLNYMN